MGGSRTIRIDVFRRSLVALVLALAGLACGGASVRTRGDTATTAAAAAARERAARLDEAERLEELETQLALSRSEARDLRAEVATLRADATAERARTVRIGGRPPVQTESLDPSAPPVEEEEPRFDPSASSGPRPLLRIWGTPPREPIPAGPSAPWVPPQLPPGLDPLPVVALPGAPIRSVVPAPVPAPVPAQSPSDPAIAEYRSALALVRDRAFDRAITALSAFVSRHPDHAYVDNAVYWRAEAFYARREYPRALAEFESVVRRYPDGNKVADALLKIGLCHLRMGDVARARTFFRRVRSEFPDSVAARLASREDDAS
jgi:tol-pal system protein YbgF